MITTDSSTEDMLDELHKATGRLLAELDPKRCFLTTQAMSSVNRVRDLRRIITHARRQQDDDSRGDRPV